jgi:hypothetical protein
MRFEMMRLLGEIEGRSPRVKEWPGTPACWGLNDRGSKRDREARVEEGSLHELWGMVLG